MSLNELVIFYNNGEKTIKPKIQHLLDDFYRVKESPITKTCEAMDRHGSNKNHRQHVIYCPFYDALFQNLTVTGLLEFGIGSQNNAFPFTMGGQPCKPGGSLRAWQELFSNAQIFGADIDRDVLFKEERITTYFADAFDFKSILDMWETIHTNFTQQKIQIIIDDAHHTLAANLNFLHYSFKHLEPNGWYSIEDINRDVGSHINGIKEYLANNKNDAVFLDIPNDTNQTNNCLAIIHKTSS